MLAAAAVARAAAHGLGGMGGLDPGGPRGSPTERVAAEGAAGSPVQGVGWRIVIGDVHQRQQWSAVVLQIAAGLHATSS